METNHTDLRTSSISRAIATNAWYLAAMIMAEDIGTENDCEALEELEQAHLVAGYLTTDIQFKRAALGERLNELAVAAGFRRFL